MARKNNITLYYVINNIIPVITISYNHNQIDGNLEKRYCVLWYIIIKNGVFVLFKYSFIYGHHNKIRQEKNMAKIPRIHRI